MLETDNNNKIINKQTTMTPTRVPCYGWRAWWAKAATASWEWAGDWEQQFREYNVSDIDDFHGYLIEQTIESKNN